MALESSKSDILQKWLGWVLGYVSRSLVSKFDQKEVSQMANHNLLHMMLQGSLSVNLNHLKIE